MSMINTGDILETIEMFTQENLDVRTVTMGISLLDCIDPNPDKACEKIYNKITTKAKNLVSAVEGISDEYGIPIVNKRISVTPIAMLLGACPDADPVQFAKTYGQSRQGRRGKLYRRLHRPCPQGIFCRRFKIDRINSKGFGGNGHSLQFRKHRCNQSRFKYGRNKTYG